MSAPWEANGQPVPAIDPRLIELAREWGDLDTAERALRAKQQDGNVLLAFQRKMAEHEADRMKAEALRAVSLADIPERPGVALSDFLATTSPEPDYEIPRLLPVQSRVILTGEEGAGKSTLGRFVGMCHAAGQHPFTGEPYPGGVTVVLDCENPPGLHQMRLAELRETLGDEAAAAAEKRLVTECLPAGIDLASPWWQEYMLRLVGGWEATLLVGGPLYKLCSLPPMSEEFFVVVSQFLDRLRAEHGCSEWIESHCRQPVAGQLARDIFPYGNSGWRRWPETGMFLGRTGMLQPWRDDRWGTEVSWPMRLARVPGSQVLWRAENGLTAGSSPGAASGTAEAAEKFRAIQAAVAENPRISLAKLRVAVGDDGTWIRKAVAEGVVIEHKAGPGKPNRYELGQGWMAGPLSFEQLVGMADPAAGVGDLEG